MKLLPYFFSVISAATFSAPAFAQESKLPYASQDTSVFEAPACNTELAVAAFKEKAKGGGLKPQGGGWIPWSAVSGYWYDAQRDLVMQIQFRKTTDPQIVIAAVKFYSLCTQEVTAYGSKIFRSDDNAKTLAILLKTGKESQLQLILGLPTQKNSKKVDVRVVDANVDSPYGGQIIDEFKANRL